MVINAPARQKELVFAILLTVTGGGVLAVMDAISKELTNSLPVIQVVWSRYFFHTIVVIIYLLLCQSRSIFVSNCPKIQIQRSFL
ncbi:MAG: hypothetical protein VX693_08735, partial [Pseudomonadota bacterium]|nr:hypothetical protein [Pseudomonadota bacterium]